MKSASTARSAVILGGGVVGLFTAWRLLDAGFAVTVLDTRRIGGSASWAAGGILSPLPPWDADPRVWQMAAESIREYPTIAAELISETGIDPEWTQSGMWVLGSHETLRAQDWARQHDLTVTAGMTEIGGSPAPALHLPWVAQVRSPRLLQALTAYLRRRGATLLEGATGARLEWRGQEPMGVVTTAGARYRADFYVLCAGAWTAPLSAAAGATLPVTPLRGQMLLLQGRPGALSSILLAGQHYLIPRRDGCILVGSTLEDVGFDEGLTAAARHLLLEQAHRIAPMTLGMPVVDQWCGLRPATPDGVPLIQHVDAGKRVVVNAGHLRNGITLAPSSARLLVALIDR